MPRTARLWSLTLACTACLMSLSMTGGAHAAAGCTTTTPALNQEVACTSPGMENIMIPSGATAVRVTAIGGGGAAGIANVSGDVITIGGNGAQVEATFLLASGVSGATVTVAAGGQSHQTSGFSAVTIGTLLVVAGGGGEGGFSIATGGGNGGNGAASGTAAGGDGAGSPGYVGGTGANGSGAGGLGCDGISSADDGESWALGGAGGGLTQGAFGGSGYGGGGGGCDFFGIMSQGGGGAGGSYVRIADVAGAVGFAPSSVSSGRGGRGVSAMAGAGGSVTLTFLGTDAQAPPSILQQLAPRPDGSCSDLDDSAVAYGTGVTGGWAPSWAQWIHEGRGGRVCGRTLLSLFGRWTIAP